MPFDRLEYQDITVTVQWCFECVSCESSNFYSRRFFVWQIVFFLVLGNAFVWETLREDLSRTFFPLLEFDWGKIFCLHSIWVEDFSQIWSSCVSSAIQYSIGLNVNDTFKSQASIWKLPDLQMKEQLGFFFTKKIKFSWISKLDWVESWIIKSK